MKSLSNSIISQGFFLLSLLTVPRVLSIITLSLRPLNPSPPNCTSPALVLGALLRLVLKENREWALFSFLVIAWQNWKWGRNGGEGWGRSMGLCHNSPRSVLLAPPNRSCYAANSKHTPYQTAHRKTSRTPPKWLLNGPYFVLFMLGGALYLPNEPHAALLPSNWLHLRNSN